MQWRIHSQRHVTWRVGRHTTNTLPMRLLTLPTRWPTHHQCVYITFGLIFDRDTRWMYCLLIEQCSSMLLCTNPVEAPDFTWKRLQSLASSPFNTCGTVDLFSWLSTSLIFFAGGGNGLRKFNSQLNKPQLEYKPFLFQLLNCACTQLTRILNWFNIYVLIFRFDLLKWSALKLAL